MTPTQLKYCHNPELMNTHPNLDVELDTIFMTTCSTIIIPLIIIPPDPNIYINNAKVPHVNDVIHLGHKLSEDIFKFNASKCVADFNCQCNMYFAKFKYANSNMCCSINTALHSMVVKFSPCLTVVWKTFIMDGE